MAASPPVPHRALVTGVAVEPCHVVRLQPSWPRRPDLCSRDIYQMETDTTDLSYTVLTEAARCFPLPPVVKVNL